MSSTTLRIVRPGKDGEPRMLSVKVSKLRKRRPKKADSPRHEMSQPTRTTELSGLTLARSIFRT
jgi:hypothetical protein